MLCSVCGAERKDRGMCGTCGNRLCSTCRVPFPAGWSGRLCKPCSSAANRRRYLANREKVIADVRARREADPGKNAANCRRWRNANLDYARQRENAWRQNNPEKVKERNHRWYLNNTEKAKETSRQWGADNKVRKIEINRKSQHKHRDKSAERVRAWVAANPEMEKQRHKRWKAANLDKIREYVQRRRARKLGCVVSTADIRAVMAEANGICALCLTYVPKGLREIDHVVPLKHGGAHCTANLQMLCRRCNRSKSAKLPESVAPPTWVKSSPPGQFHLFNPDWK